MDSKFESIIKKQEELIGAFQKQQEADQALINSQKRQIHLLNQKIRSLEKEKQELAEAGNQMSAACERLEKLCCEQQELLGSFSDIFSAQ